MFGMSFAEILVIAIIAILFLGPDKLPEAMVKIAKFFRSFKKTINEAKDTIEHEIHISELREDAIKYKDELQKSVNSITKEIDSETKEIKKSVIDTKDRKIEDV